MESDLSPCPFCGSTEVELRVYDNRPSKVVCLNCKAVGPCDNSDRYAIAFWNIAPRKPTLRELESMGLIDLQGVTTGENIDVLTGKRHCEE